MEIHPERAGEKKNRACGAIRDARFPKSGSILVVGLLLLGRELLVHLLLLLVVLADFLQLVDAFGADRTDLAVGRLLVRGVLGLVGRFLHLGRVLRDDGLGLLELLLVEADLGLQIVGRRERRALALGLGDTRRQEH